MTRNLIIIFFLSIFVNAKGLRVAVAANVSYAMPVIVKSFHKEYPKIKVEFILGSSGKLYNQIKEGAPFDLFLSANMKYPQKLYRENISKNMPKVYAKGSIALFTTKKINLEKGLTVLLSNKIKSIAIANPKIAPYGKASVEALKKSGIYNKIKRKLVYAQSVSHATAYSVVATDAGFIAKSSLYSDKMKKYKNGVNWVEVDSKLYHPIEQGIVIIKESKEAKEFYKFIFSKSAKRIFSQCGYII